MLEATTACYRHSSCSFSKPQTGSCSSISRAAFLSLRQRRCGLKLSAASSTRLCATNEGAGAAEVHNDDSSVEDAEIDELDKAIAPLRPESPAGQFLMQTLQGNPHLFHAAAEQQLELLEEERVSQELPNPANSDYVLYKRISQLKSDERRRAVQEVMYALVLQRFQKAGIKMVPKISALLSKDGNAWWSIQEKNLIAVHSQEAYEMIKEHIEMVLGGQATLSRVEPQTVAHISKLRVGQIYATSVMYGYFLKRVDERYQLEKRMNILTTVPETTEQFLNIEKRKAAADISSSSELPGELVGLNRSQQVAALNKPNDLRAYVAKFDHETLSRYATMRTHETVDLIERHAEALFGRPDLRVGPDGNVGLARDDAIQIKFGSLRALVLEATAFGSYLWDVESYVDMHYRVVPRKE